MMDHVLTWWSGIWALLERSLRIDARQRSQHLFRLVAVLAVYVAVAISEWSGGTFGAPGLRYFRQLAYLNIAFISLAGIGYFSSAITEEKEEDTLGLMLMAGISPLGILLGKSAGRLVQAALLLTVQFPFTWLAVTLGGVTRNQIVETYVSLLSFLICQANVALLFSVICRRTRDSAALTFFWQVMYFLLPLFAQSYFGELQAAGWTFALGGWRAAWLRFLAGLSHCSVTHQLQEILTSGSQTSAFNLQVGSNLLGGAAAFLLARLLFSWGTRDLATDATPRGIISLRVQSGRRGKRLRVYGNPLAWKDFHFTCGGWTVVAVKVLAHAALFSFIVYQFQDPGRTFTQWRDAASVYFGIGLLLTVLDAAWSMGRVFHEELKLQTWPALIMLPRSLPAVGYSKALGVIASLLPSLACLSLVYVTGCMRWEDIIDSFQYSEVWVIYAMAFSLIHLTTLYSVFLKWGALPLAIATFVALIFAWEQMFVMGMRGGSLEYRDVVNGMATVMLLFGCGVCHLLIGWRLKTVAAQ